MLHEVVPMDARRLSLAFHVREASHVCDLLGTAGRRYIGRLEEVEQLVAGDPRYDAVAPEARDALFEVFLGEWRAA